MRGHDTTMTRYAVYFAPEPSSSLWQFGASVLGYDAATGQDVAFPADTGFDHDAWTRLTAEPRRYGFHATLKAPFELAQDADAARLAACLGEVANCVSPVTLAGLAVAEIGSFIALVPPLPSDNLQALAGRVVVDLDHLRRPLSPADRARRLKAPLTVAQIAHLDRYGYPYVLDAFRFHMTLTGPIADADERAQVRDVLQRRFVEAVASKPIEIDALSLYAQPSRDARFRIIGRFPLPCRQGEGALA